jgi:hypothetical protein
MVSIGNEGKKVSSLLDSLGASRICLDGFELGIAKDVRSERISTDLDGQNLRSFSFPAQEFNMAKEAKRF